MSNPRARANIPSFSFDESVLLLILLAIFFLFIVMTIDLFYPTLSDCSHGTVSIVQEIVEPPHSYVIVFSDGEQRILGSTDVLGYVESGDTITYCTYKGVISGQIHKVKIIPR